MKKQLLLILVGINFFSCAGMLKSDFAKRSEESGISASDIEAVDKQSMIYYGDYQRTSSQTVGLNDQMLQTQVSAQMNKITNIFCTCVKKLADKCQSNPKGLTNSEKEIWIKGNGAAEALSLIQRSKADPLSCPS